MNFSDMTSCAWLWLYFGAFLMFLELLSPGFVIFFFGLSAATVGILRAVIGEGFSTSWQLAAFSGFAIIYLAVLRRMLKAIFTGGTSDARTGLSNEYVGRAARVTSAIRPPLAGRVLLGDAEWSASASEPIDAGSDVKVIAQDNLTLVVEKI